jgi:hypothetical protein
MLLPLLNNGRFLSPKRTKASREFPLLAFGTHRQNLPSLRLTQGRAMRSRADPDERFLTVSESSAASPIRTPRFRRPERERQFQTLLLLSKGDASRE